MLDSSGFLPPWQLLASPTDMMEGDGGSIILAKLALSKCQNACSWGQRRQLRPDRK